MSGVTAGRANGGTGGGAGQAVGGASGGAGTGGSRASAGGGAGGGPSASGGSVGQGGVGGGSGQSGSGQSGSGQSGSGQGGSAGEGAAGPRFIGRFDQRNPAAPVFAWSGTAIAVRFKGTAIGVTLTDGGSNFLEVIVDGQASVLPLKQGQVKYPLASALADGAHDVLVYRRSEANQGETTFQGFDLAASAYLPAAPAPTRRLEVIGDSISAGYGNEGTNPCAFEAKTENHYLSYEALAARTLGVELYTEAWSGLGMLRNYDGATTGTLPDRYGRTLPDRADSVWDFTKFVPHAVLINLGTNDFAKGDPTAAFQTKYTEFVVALRAHYPLARFFLAIGPMLDGDNLAKAQAYLNGVIATRAAAGDANLALLVFPPQNTQVDGVGCDYHPSLKTHQKMGDQLVATLKADLGW